MMIDYSNRSVWPTRLLLNVSTAIKGFHFIFLFVVTAAGVVSCGGLKKLAPYIIHSVVYILRLVV